MRYPARMHVLRAMAFATIILSPLAHAADGWTPEAWSGHDTLELRTSVPGEGEYWFPVWLVVLDGQVYVRLGSKAVGRVEKNERRPYLGVRVAGLQFDHVKGTPAPEMAEKVSAAMGEKYWSDVFMRWFEHPLTLRLEPESGQ
jgi:hypothetical protein